LRPPVAPGCRCWEVSNKPWVILTRVTAWLMVHGMINAEPGYGQTTGVINGFSDLIVELSGEDVGRHARTAIGVAALPLNLCVVIAAEVEIQP
jgi:enamine deaminase RidA (YjgF/YER057c/UK114 family)